MFWLGMFLDIYFMIYFLIYRNVGSLLNKNVDLNFLFSGNKLVMLMLDIFDFFIFRILKMFLFLTGLFKWEIASFF